MKSIYDKYPGMAVRRLMALLCITLLSVLQAGLCGISSYAQTGTTVQSGTVTDVDGNPLPGAGVLIKGTATGTVTDNDGRFSISVPENAVLEFSSLGFETVTAKPDIRGGMLNIVLKEDSRLLDEVVVVGYGMQARKTLTTSISKVDGGALADAPVTSVGDAIKGKVPGLRVSTSNSLSGEAPRFMIRGGSSISMGNDPIYIVDGALRDDLNGINPNDIESLEVLKDAASAGIYGARASNGVILVTTKKGSPSKGPQIVFDVQLGFQNPASRWSILNSRDYLQFIRPAIATAFANDSEHPAATLLSGANAYGTGNTGSKSIYSTRYLDYRQPVPEGFEWMYDPVDPDKVLIFTDSDWQGQWFSPAFWQKEYVGVNGGNDRIRYAASISYTGDDGIVAMSKYNVFTMHGNTSFKVTKNLEASATFDMSRQKKHIPVDNYYQCIGRGLIAAPTAMEKNLDGEWNQLVSTNKNAHSPAWYERFYNRMNTTSRMSGTFNLKWQIIEGLTANAQYNYFEQNYVGSYNIVGEADGVINSVNATRPVTETRTQTRRNTFTAHLNFNRTFAGMHNVSATAGYEYMGQQYLYLQAKSTGAVSDDVPVLQSGVNFEASNRNERQAMISYFGRLGYDFGHRYIVAATFRADGSSKFAAGNRWGYFPAASAAWVVSEEPFWKVAGKKMNTLKVRASYGLTGNNGIGLYDTYGSYSTGNYGYLSTMSPDKMQNTGMKWETTTQLDVGLDMGFLKDRIRIVLDYYDKVTDDMLFSITLPDTSPYSSVKANVGSARFYGFEAELHTVNIQTRNFTWSTDLTYAFTRNKVLSLPDEYMYNEVDEYGSLTGNKAWRIGGYTMSESGYRFGGTAVGEPLGRIYGYKVDHIIQSLAEADAALYDVESKGFRVSDGKRIPGRKDAGDYEWCNRAGSARDENGNEIINSEDMFYLGNVVPHSTGGFNNTFTFKRLTLSIYLDYALGHSIINGQKTQLVKNTMGDCNSMLGDIVYDCWRYPGDTEAKYARYTPNDTDWGNRNWRGNSSFMVEKGDYLCIRDVSLYYDLPEKWVSKLHMKKLTVGVTGNTLHYFTKVTGAVSPESGISSAGGSDMYTAVSTNNSDSDNTGNLMPNARKVIFSIKVTF
ncbi:MAG: TonB-dependent receptor [Clostridium sp.]|nr:TonB-dependent receptor [Bacteroides sp.]MCM1197659.1 TonB-dependent receptor [Clostridium sp.]